MLYRRASPARRGSLNPSLPLLAFASHSLILPVPVRGLALSEEHFVARIKPITPIYAQMTICRYRPRSFAVLASRRRRGLDTCLPDSPRHFRRLHSNRSRSIPENGPRISRQHKASFSTETTGGSTEIHRRRARRHEVEESVSRVPALSRTDSELPTSTVELVKIA